MVKKRGLGKGLDAIFAENGSESSNTVTVKISDIDPNREQPRKEFDPEALNELADSISQHGVLQPLLLRPLVSGGYKIVAGERRWRAARMAGLSEVPAVIREMSDTEEMLFALIENLQREDLSPLEEAKGYKKLIDEQSFTQEDVSSAVGKSRPAVANALRLLKLPEQVQNMLEDGRITAGHARAILSLENEEQMLAAAKKAEQGATVREIEDLAKKKEKRPETVRVGSKIQYYEEARLALNNELGRKVDIKGNKKKGVLQIEFYGEDDLKNLLQQMDLINPIN